jgi:uncharacterized membrane protein YphA (DoxX/SURF4 family)
MSAVQLDPNAPPRYDAGVSTPALSLEADRRPDWNAFQLIGFRFAFVFFAIFSAPRVLMQVPVIGSLAGVLYYSPLQAFSKWFGTNMLHVPIVIAPTGSGDTMIRWVEIVVQLGIAGIATIIWSIADRKRREYRTLHEWLRVGMRFSLAFILFGYGFAKIWPNQFPYPTLEKLSEPLGEFSPMGLLWTFMGYSVAYNFFTGMGEAVGALLLCFRRTTTLGALLLVAVMANVVYLNFAYDVPVKLFSSIYLIMALFLVLPDAKRLINVLLLNKPTEPRNLRLFATPRMERASMVARGLLLAWVLYGNVRGNLDRYNQSNEPLPRLYGIYDVQSFSRNGKDVPLVVTEPMLWRRVIFSRFDRFAIRTMSDSMARYQIDLKDTGSTFVVTNRYNKKDKLTFAFVKPAEDQLVLRGLVGSDSIVATLKRVDESKFLLTSRGFNWVQEQPFNR